METSTHFYWLKHLYMLCIILVLVGALNWGFIALFNIDLVKFIMPRSLVTVVYLLVATAALYLAVQRDTYLPFLGNSVLPTYILSEKVPSKFNLEVPVRVEPNALVVYWAATEYSGAEIQNWKIAYDQFQNSGVVRADDKGLVTLKLNCPRRYKVGLIERTLYKHVHYRVAKDNVWLSPVYTVNVENQCANFENYLDFTIPDLPDTTDRQKPDKFPYLDNQPEDEENFLAFSN
jgi:uncharacterized membrane protein YuzA (DUF378 family)